MVEQPKMAKKPKVAEKSKMAKKPKQVEKSKMFEKLIIAENSYQNLAKFEANSKFRQAFL